MAPRFEILPVQSTQSDSDRISDGESIEIIDDPEDVTTNRSLTAGEADLVQNGNAENVVEESPAIEIAESIVTNELSGEVTESFVLVEQGNECSEEKEPINGESSESDDHGTNENNQTAGSPQGNESAEVDGEEPSSSLINRVVASCGGIAFNDVFLIPIDSQSIEPEREILKTLNLVGKFSFGNEQIKIKPPSSMRRVDQLGYSARIRYESIVIKLCNEGSLMLADDNFMAKVRLVTPRMLRETTNFFQAKEVLLQQLRIEKVLQDDLSTRSHRPAFLTAIKDALKISPTDDQSIINCIQLSFILTVTLRNQTRQALCSEIINNSMISANLRQSASALNVAENRVQTRNRVLSRFGSLSPNESDQNLFDAINRMLKSSLADYKKSLLEKAPKYLQDPIASISQLKTLLVPVNDVKLFTDLSGSLSEDIFRKPLADLAARWIANIKSMNVKNIKSVVVQTNPIYYFLCRSLNELIVEISDRTDHKPVDLLTSNNSSGWHPIKKINWKLETSLTKCLEREYYFLFKLLKHFSLCPSGSRKRFEYEMKLLNGPAQKAVWTKFVAGTKKVLRIHKPAENSLPIADEFYVWCSLLDDVLAHVLPRECELENFATIFQSYLDFLCHVGHDQLESLRVITHNTARFIVQTVPYVSVKDSSVIDRQILQKQLNIINLKTPSSNNFRDLIDVFNMYWKNREDIISILPSKINLPAMTTLRNGLVEIVLEALGKSVPSEEMIAFFRTYSDLLGDLNDVPFEWYVKTISDDKHQKSLIDLSLIEPFDNKWINTKNMTYRVINPEKFAKLVPIIFEGLPEPKHYVIEVLLALLSNIKQQLGKTRWESGETLSQTDQIRSTNESISAVRNSFLYLPELPDYVSFELFYDERTKPFASAMARSRSCRDFTTRVSLIKESFWHIRKQNEMDVERALELFRQLNTAVNDELLRNAYFQYTESFNRFMQLSGQEQTTPSPIRIAAQILELVSVAPFESWTPEFKQKKLPEILAGLAAVWSIVVSKDVSSTGNYLTPHCVQILCILRLLSVDRTENGVAKHLTEILTGQGKSLVLGLMAALFALTGHKPQIVCYNRYLVTRDEYDFTPFFEMLNIKNSISYKTYETMANELIAPIIDGKPMGLRGLVRDTLLKDINLDHSKLVSENSSNSVLLIDEVDVFFTKQFYGSSFYPVARVMLPGLELIQEKIWSLVTVKPSLTSESIEQSISDYVKSTPITEQKDFQNFLARKKPYDLLTIENNKYKTKQYTNKILFEEHLRKMIKCAIEVNSYSAIVDHKLSDSGNILAKYRETFVNDTIFQYYTIFSYFRLRKTNFVVSDNSNVNYGYFNLRCGSISYSMLPRRFPLILGVSGTITALNQHERISIDDVYCIRQLSSMPSFFGCSNLQFDPTTNFQRLVSKSEWLNAIFGRANAILAAKRSVLVVFESDNELNRFHEEYSGQFDRVNVLTENTDSTRMERFVEEAGVARTITLATRGMGRGVDYKSSVSTEKHGGIHVIQTFFSLDLKEEVQIKGRTARKDNRGSYELIVCQADLERVDLLRKVREVNYRQLNEARLDLALKQNEQILKDIASESEDHEVTMRYMKTYFRT
ncbi:uncharacterized protein LOC131432008 [Malaya genurostris]|uniref:uncharacterized protein LOC131432008 n=1 Tax=Malaya genurostris TaxID=325434 RepID=UPI0026F3C3DE|nr:uncharacterized protein LOC131432008 [Malaya genurostris]